MKYYIKQKVFSFRDRFTIKDAEGVDCYAVEGKILSIGKKLYLFDMSGKELVYIEQQVISFLPKFIIYLQGERVAEIKQRFSLLKRRYDILEKDWITMGSFLGYEYTIQEGKTGRKIANIQKAWMSWGDSYEISIEKEEDKILAIAVVLSIDASIASRR